MRYKITIKEVGRDKPITTEYIGDKSRAWVVEFFGLNDSDVEWYKIERDDRIKTT